MRDGGKVLPIVLAGGPNGSCKGLSGDRVQAVQRLSLFLILPIHSELVLLGPRVVAAAVGRWGGVAV